MILQEFSATVVTSSDPEGRTTQTENQFMTDEFTTPTEAVTTPRTSIARIGILGAVAAALVAVGILAAAATATPAGTLAAGTTGGSIPSSTVGLDNRGGPGMGRMGGGITITAISGSNLTLKTVDGWTRTIAVTTTTALTKGGATIALTDLKVGDAIQFAQTRQTDGSYSITKLDVVLPHADGKVTAISGSTITVTGRDGSTATIKVTSATTYTVGTATGKALTDVKVGMRLDAVGTLNTDGSLAASAVRAFDPATMPGEHGGDGDAPLGNGPAPAASPSASASASAG